MITIGFRTGSMDEVMHQISEEYEEETDRQIAGFISVLEPTLVIILSIFIGLILISFLLPLIGIMSSIG
jgi:type IV pilus assembly protein PilC